MDDLNRLRDEEVASSNLVTPTYPKSARSRSYELRLFR